MYHSLVPLKELLFWPLCDITYMFYYSIGPKYVVFERKGFAEKKNPKLVF